MKRRNSAVWFVPTYLEFLTIFYYSYPLTGKGFGLRDGSDFFVIDRRLTETKAE